MALEDVIEHAVAAAFEVVSLADLEGPARHVERAIGARGGVFFTYPEPRAPRFLGGSFARTMADYGDAHYRGDPLHPAMRRLRRRFALHTREPWLDRRAFVRSFAFREFYRRAGVEDIAGLWLSDTPYGERDMVGMIWLGGEGLGGADLAARLEPLRVPLRQAVRRALRFERVRRERDVVTLLLGRGGGRVDVVHDRHGRTLWLSPRAQRIFPNGRVPSRLGQRLDAFRSLRGGRIPARLRSTVGLGDGVEASLFVVRDVPNGPWFCAMLEARSPSAAPVEALTPAETVVLGRMAAGRSNRVIAEELAVSLETVRTHVKRIFRKLEVVNRTQASLRARDLGLVPHEP